MFHIPMQHATTAAQVVIAANKKVDCHRCGGYGDNGTDDDGRLYACYCCGTTGRVSLDAAYQEYAEGAHERYEAEMAQRKWLAERDERAAAREAANRALMADLYADDVPF
jgi:late competence protein required for DNA uptake (superfamily II DNA/RNA helicase)